MLSSLRHAEISSFYCEFFFNILFYLAIWMEGKETDEKKIVTMKNETSGQYKVWR